MKTQPKLPRKDHDTETLLMSLVAAIAIYVILLLITT